MTAAHPAQPEPTCGHQAQDADGRWWPCIRQPGHAGFHWYRDWQHPTADPT